MAKKNTTEEQENTAGANTAPPVTTDTPDTPNTPPDTATDVGTGAPPETTTGTLPPAKTPAEQQPLTAPDLFTLDALADRHRVASWQQAALVRLTGWAEGKHVSEAEYTVALKNLQYRRMGSGRA